MPGYLALSNQYDSYFSEEYLLKIKKKYHIALFKNGIKSGKILDAGCGTGLLAIYFKDHGYDTMGVDLSREMIEIAKSKRPDIPFYVSDISESLPEDKYDAVLSSLDVVNHITSADKVKAFFENAFEHLNVNGAFIFDVNTYKKFSKEYAHQRYVYSSHHSLCVWDNDFDKENSLCRFRLKIYEKQDEKYNGREEEFCEKYYSYQTLKLWLLSVGFSDISFKSIDNGTRYIVTAIKKREKS